MCEWASQGLGQAPESAPTASRALLRLPAGPSQAAAGWRPGGTRPSQFSSQFSPLPCNVLPAVRPLLLLPFNSPNASSHRGDPDPAEEHPGMRSICNESQLRRCQQGLFQTWRGNGEGSVEAAAGPVSKAAPRTEERGHWLEWGKTAVRERVREGGSPQASPPALQFSKS